MRESWRNKKERMRAARMFLNVREKKKIKEGRDRDKDNMYGGEKQEEKKNVWMK